MFFPRYWGAESTQIMENHPFFGFYPHPGWPIPHFCSLGLIKPSFRFKLNIPYVMGYIYIMGCIFVGDFFPFFFPGFWGLIVLIGICFAAKLSDLHGVVVVVVVGCGCWLLLL
jgi:hypothetical protein